MALNHNIYSVILYNLDLDDSMNYTKALRMPEIYEKLLSNITNYYELEGEIIYSPISLYSHIIRFILSENKKINVINKLFRTSQLYVLVLLIYSCARCSRRDDEIYYVRFEKIKKDYIDEELQTNIMNLNLLDNNGRLTREKDKIREKKEEILKIRDLILRKLNPEKLYHMFIGTGEVLGIKKMRINWVDLLA